MVIIPPAAPTTELLADLHDADATLQALQDAVGGWVEVVRCRGGVLFVNEDGLRLGLPVNYPASYLAERGIVGVAVFCDADTYRRL